MNNQLQVFQSEEFGKLEVLTIDGKPYFPAKECAKVLGYKDTTNAIKLHCRWVVKHHLPHPQNTSKTIIKNFIPEGDLYRLILRSKLPAAIHFEAWVMDEILPTIRKHGAYLTEETLKAALSSQDFTCALLQRLQAEQGKTEALLSRVEELAPKARYCDRILMSSQTVPISIIAKDYGMTAVAFNRLLHHLGIQYRLGGAWLLYQRYAGKGYTKSHTYCTPDGVGIVHTCWTQKGRLFLYEFLAAVGLFPLADRCGEFEDGEAFA